MGENILVRYRLENASKSPARYEKGGFYPELRRNDGYRVSGVFIEDGDNRAHGKDERIRITDFYAGLDFYDRFMRMLVGR